MYRQLISTIKHTTTATTIAQHNLLPCTLLHTSSRIHSVHSKMDYQIDGLDGVNQWSSSVPKSAESYKKELLWRSKQRGILELDLLVGTYAKNNIDKWSDSDIHDFEKLLQLESPDLLQILLHKQSIPSAIDSTVLQQLITYTHQHKKPWSAKTGNQNEQYIEHN